MSKDFKDSETYKNLWIALKGEALAYMKYSLYKKGLTEYSESFSNIIDEIIHNEKEHWEIWFKQLHEGSIPSTIDNVIDAIEGETEEHLVLYPKFSEVAEKEGYHEISRLFKEISIIEGNHSKQFKEFKKELEDSDFYVGSDDGYWKCLNCGHIVKSKEAPIKCPVCEHPQKYFSRL